MSPVIMVEKAGDAKIKSLFLNWKMCFVIYMMWLTGSVAAVGYCPQR